MDRILLGFMGMPVLSIIPNIILYIDPGTGSIILQAVAAAVAGIAIAAKVYWHRIINFFGPRQHIKSDPPVKQTDDET